MKLLITGATGFVGSWFTQYLLDLGHDVRIMTRSGDSPSIKNSQNLQVVAGDVCNGESLRSAFSGVDTVFHFAGVVGYSRAMRQQMHKTNVEGTKNVLDACAKSNVRRLVHMSSVVAVGASFDGKTPLNENSEFNLSHLNLGYFETKLAAEKLVLDSVKNENLDAVIVNPSTIYGPGDAKKGSRKTQVKVARGEFPFYTSGGVNVIHIEDLVKCVYQAWKVGRKGERYILSGENITIHSLFEIIAKSAGVPPPRIHLPNTAVLALGKVGDLLEKLNLKGPVNTENAWASILFHWFDNTKARNELSLKPRPAREAIEESVSWMKEHLFK